jgi:hypothetical protein
MPSAELKSATRAPIPPALQELLEREAVLTMSRKRIADAITNAEKAAPAKGLSRPLFSLFSKKDNVERDKEAADNLAVLRAGLTQIETLSPIVESCLERSLENFLREHDSEYSNGLASSRFIDDWNRLLARFESSVSECMGALQGLLESIKHVPGGLACGKHDDCRKRIDVAVAAARAVQAEIAFLNKIADAQRIRSGVDAITLYRQPERNWKGAAHALHFSEGPVAIDSVGSLLEDVNEVAEKVREAIRGELQLASYAVGYGITSYVHRVWGSLREAAPLRIDPDRLEAMVDETEDLITAGRLQVWEPERRDAKVPPAGARQAAPPSQSPGAGTNGVADSAPPPAAPRAPGPVPPPIRHSQGPELRLPSRGSRPATPHRPEPAPAAPPAVVPAPGTPPDSMEELMVERSRLEQILMETRASLTERENFLNESENRLMKASQDQIERQVELEQREEQLRDLEKRLREMQASLGLAPAPAVAGTADKPPADRDEFNE